jgi:hypothetical protein
MLDYVYISETKVDMIVDQIPVRLRDRIAAELKIDLKLVSLTVKERQRPENRFARTRIAADYVVRNFEVGTVDSPGAYFEGSLPMRWGIYPEERVEDPVVYFGGATRQTILGLGGSARHIIGSTQPVASGSTFTLPGSALPSILQLIASSDQSAEPDSEGDQMGLGEVKEFTTGMKGPRENLQFLARRLLAGPSGHAAVLLGSPLYVARAAA